VDYAHFFSFPSTFAAPIYMPLVDEFGVEDVKDNIDRFAELCQNNFIEYRVHKDLYGESIPQLTKETRFADLMIIGSEMFYKSWNSHGSNEHLKHTLHNTECPVVLVPEKFNFPSYIILAYDGSASSVFAIKQFAGLFPELCDRKTILMYAGTEKQDVPDEVLIEELAARHFKDLTITKFTYDQKKEINDWFGRHKDSIVVSGSFGRSGLSELFRTSFIMDIIKKHKTPFLSRINNNEEA
jgi:hypothetical protein